jgi:hypothetical protein
LAFDRVPQPRPKTGELNNARGPKGEKRSAGRIAAFALGSFWAWLLCKLFEAGN